jgi:hypothetical protein
MFCSSTGFQQNFSVKKLILEYLLLISIIFAFRYILGKKSVELEIEYGIPRSHLCRQVGKILYLFETFLFIYIFIHYFQSCKRAEEGRS